MNSFSEADSWQPADPVAEGIADGSVQIDALNYTFPPDFFNFDQIVDLDWGAAQSGTAFSSNLFRSSTSRAVKSRVSLACVPCRSRHGRCDAIVPECSQCRASGKTCLYAESRRRGGVKARHVEHRQQSLRERVQSKVGRLQQESIHTIRSSSDDASTASRSDNSFDLNPGWSSLNLPVIIQDDDGSSTSMLELEDSSKFLELYYAEFHDAHPVVLPFHFLSRQAQFNRSSLQHLLPVMEYVGSLFAPDVAKGCLRARAERALLPENLPATGFTVQSLLIFAIAIQGCNEFILARTTLDHAVQLALQIKMHLKSFAAENSEDCAVLEESWRRTWWFLYVTDGIFSGMRHCITFSLRDNESNVDLPCDEAGYQSGHIPKPHTLEEYNMREFAGQDLVFSSFTYLIDLGQILGSVLALGTERREPLQPDVISADASLMNWALYLPKQKQLIGDAGKPDEILFQAHMLYNTLKVYLHRPLSELVYVPIERTSKCTPPASSKSIAERQRAYDFHTTKVLEAAEAGIGLFTLPSPFTKHTPLVICGLTLSILAELSACRMKLSGPGYIAARHRVRLGIGVIKALGEVWTTGSTALKEVQIIARDTLSSQQLPAIVSHGSDADTYLGID